MSFKTGILVGRFQPVHIGHEKLINTALSLCDKVLVFVSSSDKISYERNPYDAEYRISLIYKIYKEEIDSGKLIVMPLKDLTVETDLTPEWGKYVISEAEKVLGEKVEVIVYGKDKDINKCFPNEVVENITEIFISRNQLKISATMVRNSIINDDIDTFNKYTNKNIHMEYNNLREKLLLLRKE